MTQNRQTTFEEFTRHLSDERKHLIKTWLDEKSWGETVKLTAMHTITQELDGAGVTIWNMSDKYAQVLAYHRGDEDTRHGTGYLNMETLEYTLLVHVRDGSHESIHVQTECMTEVMDIWSQLTELGEQNMGDDGHQQYARSEHHIPLHDVQHEGETLVWRRDDAEVRYDFIHGTKNMYRISGHAEQLIFTGYWDAMEGIAHLTAGLTPPHGDVEYSDDGVQHVHVTGELYTPHEMFLAIAEQLAKDTADLEDFLRKNKNS